MGSETRTGSEVVQTGICALDGALGAPGPLGLGWPWGLTEVICGLTGQPAAAFIEQVLVGGQASGRRTALVLAEDSLEFALPAEAVDPRACVVAVAPRPPGIDALQSAADLLRENRQLVVVLGYACSAKDGGGLRALSQMLSGMHGLAKERRAAVILVTRPRPSAEGSLGFGARVRSTGGTSAHYYSSLRLLVEPVDNKRVQAKVLKCRTSAVFAATWWPEDLVESLERMVYLAEELGVLHLEHSSRRYRYGHRWLDADGGAIGVARLLLAEPALRLSLTRATWDAMRRAYDIG